MKPVIAFAADEMSCDIEIAFRQKIDTQFGADQQSRVNGRVFAGTNE
jgi:hypothetical protein